MSYAAVVALLGVLIFIHELGHFVAARLVGVPIARFALGFGPVVASRTVGGVRYCLCAVPLGGYVLPDLPDERAYLALPLGKRLLFSLAGPLANVLFALACYGALCLAAPIPVGATWLGLAIKPFLLTGQTLATILTGLAGLFHHPAQVSSVVGIVAEGGRFAQADAMRYGILAAHLSLSLAVFNLLPVLPLDGGKMVFDVATRLWSRLSRLYLPAAVGGWLALLGLMLFATVQDVWKYCL
ncbi:site-2 protease family protein [Desulfovibrio sp. TomC]|uniref:site-2 protease family protein n=1 Tax=Desulfovibrio sp. TomC TaxID=1562888 RepID=UPI0005746B1E|nr:site-2 protease family protein [Desulfovibrio sp. TomC]KHK04459.1 Intramembrane protease RasP/YluC, implicated in cell division based on FtsL cleavage [Desulfovibrio sp. TomC]